MHYAVCNFVRPISQATAPTVEHHLVSISHPTAAIAASSLVTFGQIAADRIVGVILKVVPESGKTTAVISYPTWQAAVTKALMPALFDENSDRKKELSRMIL
jgi:hypothetical protein